MNKRADKLNLKIMKILEHILPTTTTTNFDLDKVGKSILGTRYLGTFAIDQIPKKIKRGECFIFNLDKSNESGSHWMGAYCFKDQHCAIYDSFGRKTNKIAYPVGEYINFIDAEYDAEQKIEETSCGLRSMSFLVLCDMYGYKTGLQL